MQAKVFYQILLALCFGQVLCNTSGFHPTTHKHTESEFQTRLKASNEDHLYIHLLPHTHDDVGWLKTVDMYYTGSNQQVQWAEVHLILDSTIEQLLKDPSRKFTYVEMKFFSMWWKYQTDETKNNVRMLVEEGRLEFVNAGWSMHDEACTHYEDMIDNMMYGQQWLMQEVGVAPRIGWHVDPFGHSSANARLFADMGLDAWFFARLDYQDKDKRMEEQSLQFIWQPFYQHLGDSAQIFTGVMQDHYCWPNGFWYDERFMGDDPVVVDEKLTTFNADVKIQEMHDYATLQMAPHYQGNHIMIPMGCDFSYANANINFKNMDRLMSYYNSHYEDSTLIYSTPSDFLNALIEQDLTFPAMYEDMFPYADQPEDFWTGYFTSRANSKRQVRDGQSNLISSGKLFSEKFLDQTLDSSQEANVLASFKKTLDAMGVYQHHDGVSGTAKQYVADDYTYKMFLAMQKNNDQFSQVINEHLLKETGIAASQWQWCLSQNSTYLECPIADNADSSFLVAAYNPSLLQKDYLKVKVPHANYKVQQINPATKTFDDLEAVVFCITRTGDSKLIHDCELHINVAQQGDSLTYLAIAYDTSSDLQVHAQFDQENLFVESDFEKISFTQFSTLNGAVFNFLKKDGASNSYNVAFDVRYYLANAGGDGYPDSDNCPSGAYIFKPAKDFQDSQRYSNLVYLSRFDGGFVQEFHMLFEDRTDIDKSAMVKMRTYKNLPVSEWEVTLNSLPNNNRNGLEVTMNWKALEIDNQDVFYTDSNGLEMQRRQIDFRPQWDFSSNQKTSGNYYPVNSAIAIRDENTGAQMTVMNDRSQGGSVMETGRVELMQNRRVYYDDYRGVGEALDETNKDGQGIVVVATYLLHIFDRNAEESFQRAGQMLIDEPTQLFYSFEEDLSFTIDGQEQSRANPLIDLLGNDPVTPIKYAVFPISGNKLNLRLTNLGDKFDSDEQTVYVKVRDLGNYLWTLANGNVPLNGINIVEQTLSGNQGYSEAQAKKTPWKVDPTAVPPLAPPAAEDRPDFEVALQQQRIRMFELTYEPLSLNAFENQ